jgi:hypothetical protein
MATNTYGLDLGGLTYDQLKAMYGGNGIGVSSGQINLGGKGYDVSWNPGEAIKKLGGGGNAWDAGGDQIYYNPAAILDDPSDAENYHLALSRGADGNVQVERTHKQDNALRDLAMFAAAATGMGYGISALGAGAAGASGASGLAGSSAAGGGATGGGGLLAGGGYAIPTAEELAAAGLSPGGMGLTGAGGIGAASSVVGAGAGAAGYGAGAGMGMFDWLPSGLTDALGNKAVGALAGGLLGGLGGGSSQSGNQTITTQQQIDPRMASILYGDKGNNGFLSQILAQGGKPQSAGMSGFGAGMDAYLGNNGASAFQASQQAAQGLQSSNIGAPTAGAAQIQAPSQNGLDLSAGYKDMIYGPPGNNPYLTGAIQKGINQSTNAFGNMQQDLTKNLTQNILPGIRSGARVSGSYGGDREGLAQGSAIGQFGTDMTRAMSQFGQNNTDAAVSAQAGAYNDDRNRALSAMSGLGAQQYGVASQNAQMQQQTNLGNLQSQLSTNQLNSNNQQAGVGLSSGLLNNAYNYGTNQDSYDLNKIGKTSGLLGSYTGLGGSSTQTQPLYENKGANIAGGALLGSQLFGSIFK